ncbi:MULTISPECIES: hypothetical protein [Brevundimonas]|uniref:hypothetical protein n=1 Tax=Brevundimonas sp. UBA7507 TaxID=1946137 RepID=UPI002579AE40|nr:MULTISPECIES: hypothetical protein [Brevundimonas]
MITDDEKILGTDLFAGDFGEPGDRTMSNKMVVAAKPHQCGHCKGPIAKGERHRCFVEVFDGEMMTGRCCAECCLAMVRDYDEQGIDHMEDRIDLHDLESPYSTMRADLQAEQGAK